MPYPNRIDFPAMAFKTKCRQVLGMTSLQGINWNWVQQHKIIKLSSVSLACRRLSRTKLALKMLSHPTISTSRFYLASKMNDLRLVHQPLQHKGREGARADRRYSVPIWPQSEQDNTCPLIDSQCGINMNHWTSS